MKNSNNEEKKCIICGSVKPIIEMRNVDCLDGADSEWIYACRKSNYLGYETVCFSKYDRKFHLEKFKAQHNDV